ncbi:MAG TPA: AraC family transcriptional regulator [Desulfobacteria bacterium]|nr:AraC family transcriptional regulator [Desulfobacteria bacterium]
MIVAAKGPSVIDSVGAFPKKQFPINFCFIMHGMVENLENSIFTASTHDVPKLDKLAYWANVLAGIWGPIQIEPTNPHLFDGRIHSVKSTHLTFNEIRFRGHNIHRTARNIARMKQGFYVLAFPRENPWTMTQEGKDFTLKPGNMYLLSNTVPYKSHDKAGYDTFNVIIPSRILENLVPGLELRYMFNLGPADKKANILHDFVKSFYRCLPFDGEEEALFMENSLLNLLTFLLMERSEDIEVNDSSVKLAHRRRVLDYIDKRLNDEFMSPETIARQNGLSAGYLHRIFKPSGATIMEMVREKRLCKAHSLLANPKFSGLSVTEVAYMVGFKHPSDFSRAYKRMYGFSPKETRFLRQK